MHVAEVFVTVVILFLPLVTLPLQRVSRDWLHH